MIDPTKIRIFTGALAAILALAGVLTLVAGLVTALQTLVHPAVAMLLVGLGMLLLAGVGLWVFINPGKSLEKESEQFVEAASSALVNVPLEQIREMIRERPLAALALFSGAGALFARQPQLMMRIAERLMDRFT